MPESQPQPGAINGDLRARAKRAIRTNLGLDLPAAKQWWNWQAKKDVAERNGELEKWIHGIHHNDHEDALRHAEWARLTAQDAGPAFATVAGIAHEIQNLAPTWIGGDGLPMSETEMDLRNNSEGVRSFRQGRPIDPSRVQDRPRGRPGFVSIFSGKS